MTLLVSLRHNRKNGSVYVNKKIRKIVFTIMKLLKNKVSMGIAKSLLLSILGLTVIEVSPAFSAVFTDIEGVNTSGVNDTDTTAQNLGYMSENNSLKVQGYIDMNNLNDVDFYQFSLEKSLGLFFDIDFANDIGATSDDDIGLDPELWIFNNSGTLIASNDDSDFFETGEDNQGTDPGSDTFGDLDSFIGELNLNPGIYYAAVSYYGNDANASLSDLIFGNQLSFSGDSIIGAEPDTTFTNDSFCEEDIRNPLNQCTGQYQLKIRTTFDEQAVPEPSSLLGILTLSLTGIGFLLKRKSENLLKI